MQKKIELDDLMSYVMVGHPQISPNAEKICFMVTKHNLSENAYDSNLWLVNRTNGKLVQFTTGGSDRFPVWAKDGKQIAFTSRRRLKKEDPGSDKTGGKIKKDRFFKWKER